MNTDKPDTPDYAARPDDGPEPPTPLAAYVRECMAQVGITSIRGLAARAGISTQTAWHLLTGSRVPSEETLQKVDAALPTASLTQLRLLAQLPSGEREPFVLPARAAQLSVKERAVILAMIDALLDAHTIGVQRTDNDPLSDVNDRDLPQSSRLVGRPRDPNE